MISSCFLEEIFCMKVAFRERKKKKRITFGIRIRHRVDSLNENVSNERGKGFLAWTLAL